MPAKRNKWTAENQQLQFHWIDRLKENEGISAILLSSHDLFLSAFQDLMLDTNNKLKSLYIHMLGMLSEGICIQEF